MTGIGLALILGGIALLVVLGVGALVLVKLGVLVHYAVKDDPPDQGEYRLDASREPGEG